MCSFGKTAGQCDYKSHHTALAANVWLFINSIQIEA